MRCILIALLGGLRAATALGGEAATPVTATIDIAVLTPAVEGKFSVASGIDLSILVTRYFGVGHLGDQTRTTALRSLVARERYEPARPFADRLIEALGAASYRAVHEPIKRKPAGSMQTLAWGDLPERPQGEIMLDVTIRWICLCSDVAFTKFYPAIGLGWRLLGSGQRIVEPTREITYFHFPASYAKEKAPPTSKARVRPQPEYPIPVVSENCGYDSIKDAEKNPQALWGCFGEAFGVAVERLVIDLKRLRPPHAPITVSGDNLSGISTR